MKKTRKLLALLMALTITLSILTFPASAATKPDEEPVSPEYFTMPCPECAGGIIPRVIEAEEPYQIRREPSCGNNNAMVHNHEYYHVNEYFNCRNCGYAFVLTIDRVYCMGVLIREIE